MEAIRIAKQRHKESSDVRPAKIIKDKYGESLTNDTKFRAMWRESFFKLFMNLENGRVDRDVIAVDGGQMDEVSEGEVERA